MRAPRPASHAHVCEVRLRREVAEVKGHRQAAGWRDVAEEHISNGSGALRMHNAGQRQCLCVFVCLCLVAQRAGQKGRAHAWAPASTVGHSWAGTHAGCGISPPCSARAGAWHGEKRSSRLRPETRHTRELKDSTQQARLPGRPGGEDGPHTRAAVQPFHIQRGPMDQHNHEGGARPSRHALREELQLCT